MSFPASNSNICEALAAHDNVMQKMLDKISQLELKLVNGGDGNFQSDHNPKQTKSKKPPTVEASPAKPIKKTSNPKSSPKTPNQRARSSTPNSLGPSSNKKSPLQMLSNEQPAGFERTKVSFFFFMEAFDIQIKLIWGMLTNHSITTPLDPAFLTELFSLLKRRSKCSNMPRLVKSSSAKVLSTSLKYLLSECGPPWPSWVCESGHLISMPSWMPFTTKHAT
ncbi:hypothetical protein VP01_719g5 [Puccinia sorghi]|uniref:Uncharacterized protein n=1 Tax=Puccinia sorghi TaxID=27349 RepID=A0A0L6UDE1_9BASI|nr:hypothetical protein VP01_719g5 [Puccinia sorghi]